MTTTQTARAGVFAAAVLLLAGCSASAVSTSPSSSQTSVPAVSAAAEAPGPTYTDPRQAPKEWPADAANYQFSLVPDGPEEQWLFDNWPTVWARGVRAVSTYSWTGRTTSQPAGEPDDSTPGALVQYIGGVRYDGSVSLPLRFPAGVTDGSSLSSVGVDATIASMENQTRNGAAFNSYQVRLTDHDVQVRRVEDKTDADYPASVQIYGDGYDAGKLLAFDTMDEAIAYVMGGVAPYGTQDSRVLYPGEISSIIRADFLNNNGHLFKIFDPRTGGWTPINY